ncbi:hypothetical protein O3M35_001961 [Rhynocoris fuscipes]|uniref:Cns1/TTC4 wheel domain-containing protein n=1 Tax=Rhynocoris fuscipes TaxID=488301 RepID=A0AAW1CQS5_9HEMI
MDKKEDNQEKSKVKSNLNEERLKLAETLDKELEDYISNLEKRSTNEAWPEDKWQEEMEKHPFFMTEVPKDGELPPLLQGLQELKYSTEENTPEDLAKAYKDDGNYHFKLKKYRMAILCYTEGIKQRSYDVELNANLYNNRAAAHYFIGNYRSCYNDCKCAVKALPEYPKALCRLADTCFKLGLYDECLKHCEMIIKKECDNKEIMELMKMASKKKKEKDYEDRRQKMLRKKAAVEKSKILEAIKERGINLVNDAETDDETAPNIGNNIIDKGVHFVDNRLVWPVLLIYPEYETSDIIEKFHEDHSFLEELTDVFSTYADWDYERRYSLETINLYYENELGKMTLVNINSTLGSLLSKKDFRIENGMPTFLVLVKDSETERKLLKSS